MPREPVLRRQTVFRPGLWLPLTVRHPGSLHLQEVWGPRLCKAGGYIYQWWKHSKNWNVVESAGLGMVESWKGDIRERWGSRSTIHYTR
jgi:hypothetical protein